MSDWFEREEARLVDEVNAGDITEQQYREEMRCLRDELLAEAEEAADRARNDVLGTW